MKPFIQKSKHGRWEVANVPIQNKSDTWELAFVYALSQVGIFLEIGKPQMFGSTTITRAA
jgi:hypothetical protein